MYFLLESYSIGDSPFSLKSRDYFFISSGESKLLWWDLNRSLLLFPSILPNSWFLRNKGYDLIDFYPLFFELWFDDSFYLSAKASSIFVLKAGGLPSFIIFASSSYEFIFSFCFFFNYSSICLCISYFYIYLCLGLTLVAASLVSLYNFSFYVTSILLLTIVSGFFYIYIVSIPS